MITRETTMCSCNGTTREKVTYYGKSTDEKPIQGSGNADVFYEMDTGNVFMFDQETQTWLPQ